jgi:MFS family permease
MPDAVKLKPNAVFLGSGPLFFIQWMAAAAWTVPLSLVLKAHGLGQIIPYAFATSALASFVSPLIFGAMADRHFAPVRVLRWLALASMTAVILTSTAIQYRCNPCLVLALIQLYALCTAPTTSISTAIVMSTMNDPRSQFGPVRAMGTLGWMAGGWLISLLSADASPLAGLTCAATWLGLAAFTLTLPHVEPPENSQHLSWHERLGLDALTLLRQRDHRVVFLVTTLISIPMQAFYQFTPIALRDAGFTRVSAWTTLGQTTELVAMFSLGALFLRWRVKWILALGLFFAVLRFAFCAVNGKLWLLGGVMVHGVNYALVFATAAIYVNERVDPAWRARAQALLSLLNGGVGNLIGALGTGWWFAACTTHAGSEKSLGTTNWPVFWGGLSAASAAVLIYFLVAYRGRAAESNPLPVPDRAAP